MATKFETYKDLTAAGWGHRTTIWRKIREGLFPRPDINLGTDTKPRPGWYPETIRRHEEDRRVGGQT